MHCHRIALSLLVTLVVGTTACDGPPSRPSPIADSSSSGAATSGSSSASGQWGCGPSSASGTAQMSGVVTDTEDRPIPDTRLKNVFLNGGAGCPTNADGAFTVSYPQAIAWGIEVTAPGYNAIRLQFGSGMAPGVLDFKLQQNITLQPGTPVTLSLNSNDLLYFTGEPYESEYCGPCKVIDVRGGKTASIRWTGDVNLQMWASNGYSVAGAHPDGENSQSVDLAGFTRLYVGLPVGRDLRPAQLAATTYFEVSIR